MTHHSSAFKERTSLADPIFAAITLIPRTMGFVAFLLPSVACAQVIVDFGASYPMSVKDLDNGDQLIVCRRPFGGSIVDSTYLETGIAGVDWDITPVVTKRIAAAGNWSLTSALHTSDGLLLNGTLTSPGSSNASLVRLNNDGDVVWCNEYTSEGFGVALRSADSIVAFASAGPLLHRVVVGPDGTAMGNIAISNTEGLTWSIVSGCNTNSTSEHVVAGAVFWENTWRAAIARIGPTGSIWMKKYYVPIPWGVGPSSVSRVIRADDGGYTCIINAMDQQIPGIYYYSCLMHFDDDGNVLWCRGSTIQGSALSMESLVQLDNGDYIGIVRYDLADSEIYRYSSSGAAISRSLCQAPCNMHSLNEIIGTEPYGHYIRTGHMIAELGMNGAPCGRSTNPCGSPTLVNVSSSPITPGLVTTPSITAAPISLADRSPVLSATITCGTTSAPSVPSLADRFRAYPVPSDGSVTLEFGTGPTYKRPIELRDVHGRLVMQGAAPGALDISSLEPGIYDCTVIGTTQHLRLVKE